MSPSLAESRVPKLTRLVAVFGLAQASIAVGGLIRIPIMIEAVGLVGLGAVMVTGAVMPLLLVPGAGLRSSARALVAESIGHGGSDTSALHRSGVTLAWQIGLLELLVFGALALLDPLRLPPGSHIIVASVAAVVLAVLALDGMWWWGVLEALDRAEIASLAVVAVSGFGVLATIGLAVTGGGLGAFIVLNAATSTLPPLIVSLVGRRVWRRTVRTDASGSEARPTAVADVDRLVRSSVRLFVVRGLAAVVTRGTDPLVLNAIVSTTAVSIYSVAQRLGSGINLVAQALLPRFAAQAAYRRAAGDHDGLAEIRRTMARLGLLALGAAIGFVTIGPAIATRLAGEEAGDSLLLYVAFAVLGVLWTLEAPLEGYLTGPRALRHLNRILMTGAGLNLTASIVLAAWLGVIGPVIGSALAASYLLAAELRLLTRHQDWLTETISPANDVRPVVADDSLLLAHDTPIERTPA